MAIFLWFHLSKINDYLSSSYYVLMESNANLILFLLRFLLSMYLILDSISEQSSYSGLFNSTIVYYSTVHYLL